MGSFSIIKRNDFGDGWGTGIKGGLGIENQIYSNFGVRTGLFYASRGYSLGPAFGRYEYSLENVVYEMPYTNKLKRNFLQVPLLLTYTHSLNQSLALSFGLGPYVGISVKDYWEGGYSEGMDGHCLALDRKSTRLNSSHIQKSRMPSSA